MDFNFRQLLTNIFGLKSKREVKISKANSTISFARPIVPLQNESPKLEASTAERKNESTVHINTIEQFSTLELAFEGIIDLGVGDHLLFNMLPVLFGGPKGSPSARAAVVVNERFAGSDEAKVLLKMLNDAQGASTWQVWAGFSKIVVSDTLILALSRGQISKATLKNKRDIVTDKAKHSFFVAFRDIIAWGVREHASDVHFNVNFQSDYSEVKFHINGRYVAPERFRIATRTMLQMLKVAWMAGTGGNGPVFDHKIEQQCRIELDIDSHPIMLRWASVSTEYPGPSVTTRIVKVSQDGHIPSLSALSYLPQQIAVFERAMKAEKGAMIMAGVMGSGKSITLAALMACIPAHRKTMGVEDPVEHIIHGMIQKSINRPLEGDTGKEFDAVLKTIKRIAANDVLLGEIRDRATGSFFVDVVLTGTSMFTTTHAPSAPGVFDKLASDMVGVSRDFLSTPGNIKLVTYQALLPKLCSCSKETPLSLLAKHGDYNYSPKGAAYIKQIEQLYKLDVGKIHLRNPNGCSICRNEAVPELNGFKGRTLAAEMIEPDERFLSLVKEHDSIGALHHFKSLRGDVPFDDPRMTGKTAMECAVYKMSIGEVDPREIEPRFHSFEREAMYRNESTY